MQENCTFTLLKMCLCIALFSYSKRRSRLRSVRHRASPPHPNIRKMTDVVGEVLYGRVLHSYHKTTTTEKLASVFLYYCC